MTLLDDLRVERDEVLKHAVKELRVPPTGRIVVRFRPPADRDELAGLVSAYRVRGELTDAQERQLIVTCCDEILRLDPDTLELVAFDDSGEPLRFDGGDERWGTDVKTARDCVGKLYNVDKQPLVLAGITDALADWLQGTDAEIAARVEGNSLGGEQSSATPPESTSAD